MRRAVLVLALLTCTRAAAQSGSSTASLLGAGLAGTGTALLGATGALAPCALTRRPATCTRTVALFSGAVGATAGAALGGRNADAVTDRWTGAAWGSVAGAAVGIALMPTLQEWSPRDALALALMGGALGSAPIGSMVGFGAGLVFGALREGLDDDGTPFGVLAYSLAGVAAGALTEWVVRAADQRPGVVAFSLRVPLP